MAWHGEKRDTAQGDGGKEEDKEGKGDSNSRMKPSKTNKVDKYTEHGEGERIGKSYGEKGRETEREPSERE